jgi:hypothetical protein
MAGWRARQAGDGDEPIELVDDGDRSEVEVAGGRTVDWHATLRTGAAVVAALALVWIGRSFAAEHRAQERTACSSEVSNAYWRYENAVNRRSGFQPDGPLLPDDVFDELAQRARDCGDELLADAFEFERTYDPEDD